MGPTFQHDCPTCVFLGQHTTGEDLYYCPQGGTPTLIARRSSDPGDYSSGMPFVGYVDPITAAYDLAKKRGLIP